MPPFMDELLRFPSSRHDDQIDALTQFLEHLANLQRMWRGRDRKPVTRSSRSRFPNGTWFERVGLTHSGLIR